MARPLPVGHEKLRGLEIRVLGPLEVNVDGRPLVVDTRKALAILALLAVENRPFGRDEVAAMLWPESDDTSARGALRRTLSVLRAALGDRWLHVDRAHVSLDRTGIWLDLTVVEDVLDSLDVGVLQTSADVARGPFLAGFALRDSPEFDDWRATRAAAADRVVGRVLDQLAEVAESEGDTATAAAAAVRRIALDELDEGAHRRLMAILARAGDRTGAIRQYRACVAVLERELGVPPLAETTSLYEAIRDAQATPDIQPRVAAPPILAVHAGLAAGALPLVGREAELESLLAAHRSATRHGRLVLVTGEAGIGKSRLVDAGADVVRAHGGTALVVRSHASERGIPYGSIIGLLRAGFTAGDVADRLRGVPAGVLGEIDRLVALPAGITAASRTAAERPSHEPAARARLLDAIATTITALAAGPGPGLVAVEDVQWADDASLEAMAWLCRRLLDRPILVACTWRPEDLDNPEALAAIVESLPWTTQIALGRLDLVSVQRLVAAAAPDDRPAPDGKRLFEESEGLPLYVVEALAPPLGQLADGAVRGVRALLRERIASVSDAATQVMAAAAVIGRSFDISQVRGTSGRSEEEVILALEELVRRGIVREQAAGAGAAFDFVHGRLREAAYAMTSLARRRLLHRRAAALLRAEPAGRDPGRLVQIAQHERSCFERPRSPASDRGDQVRTVARERDLIDPGARVDGGKRSSRADRHRVRRPDPYPSGDGHRCDQLPARGERRSGRRARAAERGELVSSRRAPEAGRAVLARRQHRFAIRGEHNVRNQPDVTAEDGQAATEATAARVPDADGFHSGRQQPALRAEGDAGRAPRNEEPLSAAAARIDDLHRRRDGSD